MYLSPVSMTERKSMDFDRIECESLLVFKYSNLKKADADYIKLSETCTYYVRYALPHDIVDDDYMYRAYV